MANILGRDTKLATKRRTRTVEIPELECSVILKELSIGQMNQFMAKGGDVDIARQLAMSIVDEHGDRVFESDEDIQNLLEMSTGVMMRLMKELSELNGVSKEAVDDALKNSKASLNGNSDSV